MDARTIDPDCLPEVMNAIALFHACQLLSSVTGGSVGYWRYRLKKEAVFTFRVHSRGEIETLIDEVFD